jgi:4-diphosphocytidyl-2C-methyl-D-erythritol kinase
MSGSGSSLFTLFDEEPDASAAAAAVERRFPVRALARRLAPAIPDDLNEVAERT